MTKDLVTTGPSAMTYDYGDLAVPAGEIARGFEGQTNKDVAIPFVKLLQSNSPEVVKRTVDGAQPGMWLNTATKKLYRSLLFVAGYSKNMFTRFVPRDQGGGFVGQYEINDPIVLKALDENKRLKRAFGEYYVDSLDGKRTGKDGDELSETFYLYGVVCDEETEFSVGMAILAFKSTMIKCYKGMMTQLRQETQIVNGRKVIPPLFSHLLRFNTEGRENKAGYFFVPTYSPGRGGDIAGSMLAPDDERLLEAMACGNLVREGSAIVNYDNVADDGLPKGDDGKPLF